MGAAQKNCTAAKLGDGQLLFRVPGSGRRSRRLRENLLARLPPSLFSLWLGSVAKCA